MRRRAPLQLLAALAVATMTLTGCSAAGGGTASKKDPTAHARLDYKTGEIILPLDEYDVLGTWADSQTLQHAQQLALGKCMAGKGDTYRAAALTDGPETNVGDRQYGLWDVGLVKKYGYFPPNSLVNKTVDEDGAAGGASWKADLDYCYQHMPKALADLYPSNTETTRSIVPRLQTEAFNAASADPAWQKAREKWWGCLRKKGLDPQTGSDQWNTKQAEQIINSLGQSNDSKSESNPEQLIQIAYTEARCNVDTGMAQTLGNLEAAYQKPLIDQNQAALNKVKERKQQRLTEAQQYIAANG